VNNLVNNNLPSIGGDFEINFDDNKILKKTAKKFKINYNKKYNYYTDCGRSAIFLALKILKKKNKNLKALLPFYCCPSIIQPFKKYKIKILFYNMGKDLNSPKNLPKNTDNTILLFIHYFGKKNSSILEYICKQKKKSKNFFVIEDLVQTCFSRLYRKYVGDFLVTSLRKFLPVPDGAILATNYEYNKNFAISNFDFLSKRIFSKALRTNNKYEKLYLDLYKHTEKILDREIKLREISPFSKLFYENLNINYIQNKRVTNWKKLHNSINNKNKNIKHFYSKITKDEVPLAYPILINPKKRTKFINYLKKNRIYCAIHWNLDYKKINKIFYDDYKISKSIISIPIDHRMSTNMINKLVRVINEF